MDRHETAGRPGALTKGALALLTAFLAASALSFWPYTVDDAFISLRYGQNLAEYGELVWNRGEWVEGFSNPLWTLFGAGLVWIGAPPVLGLKLAGLLAALLCVPATYGLARQLGLGERWGLVAAAIVGTNASVALWGVAGLETSSFGLLLLLTVWRFEAELTRPEARPLSALLLVLLWASRPEAPAYLLYFVVRRGLALPNLRVSRRDLHWALLAALPIAAYEVWGLVTYGGLFPATHAAKVGGGPPLLQALAAGRGERFLLYRFLFHQGWGFAALWVGAAACAVIGRRRVPVAAWCVGFSGLFFVAYAFTDWMPRFRFLVPPLPFLAIGAAAGFGAVVDRLDGGARRLGLGAVLVLLLAASWDQATRGYDRAHNIAIAVEARGPWPLTLLQRVAAPWEPGRQELDAWAVLELTDPSETIACPDIGFIGALCRNPIWDIRGLVTPTAADFLNVPEDDPGREGARRVMLDEMYAANPALILLPTRPQGMAPTARRFLEALEEDGRVLDGYLRRDDLLPFRVCFVRKDLGSAGPGRGARVLGALEQLPSYRTALMQERSAAYR